MAEAHKPTRSAQELRGSDPPGTESVPEVSVVIPAYKRPELLSSALESVLSQNLEDHRYEVIVVDSSPDDRNAAVVEALGGSSRAPALRLYQKPPEGPGPSRQLGASRARGKVVAFLDSDCQATPGWLRAGLAAFDDGIGIVQGRTLPDPTQSHGVFTRYVRVEAENPRYEAANIFYRRECLEQAGEPSRDMTPNAQRPMGGEDTLVAWRVKRRGWQSTFASDALVYHEVLPVGVWFWLCDKRMFMVPWLVRQAPEIRTVLLWRLFLDRAHACLLLALVGCVLTPLSWLWLLCWIPYVLVRASEPTRTLTGVRRAARVLLYLPRDFLSMALLALGSLRFRAVVL